LPGICSVCAPGKYAWNAVGSTVADISTTLRSSRSLSTRRSKVRRKSVCKSRSWTSSTTMCVAPSTRGLLCMTFSKIPTVQKISRVSSVMLSSNLIL